MKDLYKVTKKRSCQICTFESVIDVMLLKKIIVQAENPVCCHFLKLLVVEPFFRPQWHNIFFDLNWSRALNFFTIHCGF